MDDITRLPAAGHTDLFVVTGARAASDQTDLDKQLMFDRTHRTLWLAAVVSVAVMIQTQNTHAADWPQLQGNPGHTGYTSDEPKPPYALKWIRQLKQPTHPGVPPIVAKGKVFLGTAWGNLLALDGNTGETTWTFKTGSAICGTPVFDQGLVYVTSMDRFCYAVNAETGKQVWAFETFEGIWAGPVVAEGKVFVAGRDAKVHAVNAETGSALWEASVGAMVLATPAYDDGVLYVGAGDNCVYALDAATGRQLWKSDKLPGMAIRDYWLVAGNGVVIGTTQLVFGSHPTFKPLDQQVMAPYRKANSGKLLDHAKLLPQVKQWLIDNPDAQTVHVLDAKSGARQCVPPIISVHGGGCTGPLPVMTQAGETHTMFTNVRLAASGWAFVGKLNLANGTIDPLINDRYYVEDNQWEWQAAPGRQLSRQSMFAVGFCVSDQSWGLSRGGNILFCLRDPGWAGGEAGYSYIDLSTGDDKWLLSTNDQKAIQQANWNGSYGGAFHATAAPFAISGKKLFHKRIRNFIVCLEGN